MRGDSADTLTLVYLARLRDAFGTSSERVVLPPGVTTAARSEEHTSELQSHRDLHSFPTRRSSDLDSADTLTLVYLARLRDAFGTSSERVVLPPGVTTAA